MGGQGSNPQFPVAPVISLKLSRQPETSFSIGQFLVSTVFTPCNLDKSCSALQQPLSNHMLVAISTTQQFNWHGSQNLIHPSEEKLSCSTPSILMTSSKVLASCFAVAINIVNRHRSPSCNSEAYGSFIEKHGNSTKSTVSRLCSFSGFASCKYGDILTEYIKE